MTEKLCAVLLMIVSAWLVGFAMGRITRRIKRTMPPVAKGPRFTIKSPDEYPFDRSTPNQRAWEHFGMLQRTRSFPGNYGKG